METNAGTESSNNSDWQGLGDLITLGSERLTRPVEGMHRAITDRWTGFAGSWGAPIRQTSRVFTTPIYGAIRLVGEGVGRTVGFVATTGAGSKHLGPLWESRLGSGVQSVVNGLWGDELERQRSKLSIETSIRSRSGEAIEANPEALAAAFPEATPRVVLLLHGLGDTEHGWTGRDLEPGLAATLTDHSFTPLLVRYNSGRSLSDNGRALSILLEQVIQMWPVAVSDVSLVGHSMGGLVAHNSLLAADEAGHRWRRQARNVVTLGTPHLGTPLEKSVHWASRILAHISETRPIGEFLDQRSTGIKDLGSGLGLETDGEVAHYYIAGAVTSKPGHPLAKLLGDLVVPVNSAIGTDRRKQVAAADVRVFAGRNHRALIHDPDVHEEILDWLTQSTSE